MTAQAVAADPTAPVLSADALGYRDTALGKWSSHPYWQAHGSRMLRRWILGVLLVFYAAIFYVWLRGHSLSELLVALTSWFFGWGGKFAIGLAALASGMLMAGSFQLRWALRMPVDERLSAGNAAHRAEYSLPLIATIAASGLVLPLLLNFMPGLPAELRLLGPLLAFLPAASLSYVLVLPSDPQVRFPWVSLVILAPAFWLLALVPTLLALLQSLMSPWLAPIFPTLESIQGWRSAMVALALGATLVGLFRLALWYRSRSLMTETGPQEPMQPVVMGEAESGRNEGWVKELIAALGLPATALSPLAPTPEETVDWQENSDFEVFFDGAKPTQDQHKTLIDFCHLMDSWMGDASSRDSGCGFDMLLQGPSGSGRSATLHAIALLSAVEYGSNSIVLVPDEARARIVVDRLRAKIERLHLAEFVVADLLTEAQIATGTQSVGPEICVTTIQQWEALLPGRRSRDQAVRDQVRLTMCQYSTVLVDDWLEHPLPAQLHLPFVIDKHRLLLEAEMIPSARVFTFPRLTESGKDIAVDRLIGDSGLLDEARQVSALRYRCDLSAQTLDIEAEDLTSTIDRIAAELSKLGQSCVLMRHGIDEEEAGRQTEEFRAHFQKGKITVCYCNDQLDAILGALSSIVMRAADGPDAVFALRARRKEDGVVIIRVRNTRELQAPKEVTPLIVDRSGRGIAEAHFYNILRFVPVRTPLPQRIWGQLGVRTSSLQATGTQRDVGRLVLDSPELVCEAFSRDRSYLRSLGAYMALDEPYTRLDAVDPNWIPDPGLLPWRDAGDEVFGPKYVMLPEPPETGASRGSTALWRGNAGEELGRSQLQYADELLLRRGHVFFPKKLRQEPGGGVEINSSRFRDNGQDAIHPKFELSWSAEEDGHSDPVNLIASVSGGPEHGFLWLEPDQPIRRLIHKSIVEMTDGYDRPTPAEIQFEHPAFTRTLLLAPTKAVIDRYKEFRAIFNSYLTGAISWSTSHPDLLPGVTYALTRGLEMDLPSSAFLGRILAFKLNDQLSEFADAIVWFVEPEGTGMTLSNSVDRLLKEDGYLGHLGSRMDAILAQGWDKSPSPDIARFWLPRNLRKGVSLFERRLVIKLARMGHDEGSSKDGRNGEGQASLQAGRWKFVCPECKTQWEQEFDLPGGLLSIKHCGKTAAMLVPTEGSRCVAPRSLVTAWWPADVRKPKGSETEVALAVWKIIADRLEYIEDTRQVEGLGDLWLSASETWARTKGDSEDHSILVIAMLKTLGVKSWLTWGTADGGGHAWVEAHVDGQQVLIEATCKSPLPDKLAPVDYCSPAYGQNYRPSQGEPCRTDGSSYDLWDGKAWVSVMIPDAVPVVEPQLTPSADPHPTLAA